MCCSSVACQQGRVLQRPRSAGSVAVPTRCGRPTPDAASAPCLPDVLVLGNSFAALADSLRPAERASTAGWCRVTRVAHLATEAPCETLAGAAHVADFGHAFAASSLHTFDAASMPAEGDELWECAFEPTPEAGDEGLLADFAPG